MINSYKVTKSRIIRIPKKKRPCTVQWISLSMHEAYNWLKFMGHSRFYGFISIKAIKNKK